MGQHRIQRALLNNFAFPGTQKKSMMTWTLDTKMQRPHRKSTKKTGFFETTCSPEVDELITRAEQDFLPVLIDLREGHFSTFHNDQHLRTLIQFVSFHYVRSNAFNNQISHLTETLAGIGQMSADEATAESTRLTSHQHRETYIELTNAVASCLTHFTFAPLTVTGTSNFITSDNIVGVFLTPDKRTVVWFPVGTRHGIWATNDRSSKQILGPTTTSKGHITFTGIPESPILSIQDTPPHERDDKFFATVNSSIAKGSNVLFAHAKEDIDLTITFGTENTSQYIYTPLRQI